MGGAMRFSSPGKLLEVQGLDTRINWLAPCAAFAVSSGRNAYWGSTASERYAPHASFDAACRAAELMRTQGTYFSVNEIPGLGIHTPSHSIAVLTASRKGPSFPERPSDATLSSIALRMSASPSPTWFIILPPQSFPRPEAKLRAWSSKSLGVQYRLRRRERACSSPDWTYITTFCEEYNAFANLADPFH